MRSARYTEKAAAWLLLSAAAALALRVFVLDPVYAPHCLSCFTDRGELLFHALRDKAVSFAMPLPGLLFAWFRFHMGGDPYLPVKAAGLLSCLAAYSVGRAGGPPARGAFFALAAALAGYSIPAHDPEQVLYSFALLVFLRLELLRQSSAGVMPAAAAGLSAGFSMLVRSPLFAFPPLAAAWGLLRGGRAGRTGRGLAAAGLFIVCAYLPLAPWAGLNYSLFDSFIPLEESRPASNVIAGAKGLVFTMEGDARAFAGISRDESVYAWAARTVLADPGAYAGAVLRRLAAAFMMSPWLFLLAGAGLALCRSPGNLFTAFMAGYFILVHCLLAIEPRYFQPLKYLLAMMAAAGAWRVIAGRKKMPSASPEPAAVPALLFAALALPSAAALAKVLAYPSSAGTGLPAVTAEAAKYPSDEWLLRREGETLLAVGMTAAGLDRLGRACGPAFPGLCYLASLMESPAPAAPSRGLGDWYELALVKALRELQLGRFREAEESLAEARLHWLGERNAVRGAADREHLDRIRETNPTFLDHDLRRALIYWTPAERSTILSRLARLEPLTPRLKGIMLRGKETLTSAEARELAALDGAFADDLSGAEYDWPGNLRALSAALLAAAPPPPADAGGPAGLLLSLRLPPERTLERFAPPSARPVGPALRAAAAAFILPPGSELRREAARLLRGTDKDDLAYALIWLGEERYSAAAMEEFRRGLDERPYPLAAGALAYALRGEREKALELARAAAARPLTEAGWQLALQVFQSAGEYVEGAAAAGRALSASPGSPSLLNSRGVLRSLAGDAAGARADFEAALRARPGYFPALMGLGLLMERAGEKERAAGLYRDAVEKAGPDAAGAAEARRALRRL
jgi:hypothetical protein